MATDGRTTPPIAIDPPFDPEGPLRYDAFISYSWKDAKAHATAVNEALRSLARPAEQIRALEVFLDRSAMRVSPELWREVAGHLDASRHLVLLLSPKATDPDSWVSDEIRRRLATKKARELTLVLVQGSAVWDVARNDFDHEAKDNAVPPALWGELPARPRIIDLTEFRTEAELDLSHPPFRARCLELAAAVRGEAPEVLEALEQRERASELRRRRRTRSTSGFTTTALVLTGLLIVGAAVYSGIQLERTSDSDRTARERQVRAEADGLAARATGSAAPICAFSWRLRRCTSRRPRRPCTSYGSPSRTTSKRTCIPEHSRSGMWRCPRTAHAWPPFPETVRWALGTPAATGGCSGRSASTRTPWNGPTTARC